MSEPQPSLQPFKLEVKTDIPLREPENGRWLNYLTTFVPPEKLQKGVYTEIHSGPDGHLYVTPEVVCSYVHYATIGGNHSMWESKQLFDTNGPNGEKLDRNFINAVPFNTDSLVAKGILVFDPESGLKLRVDETRKLSEADIMLQLATEQSDLGIANISVRENSLKAKELRMVPEFGIKTRQDVYHQKHPTAENKTTKPVYSGLVTEIRYTDPKSQLTQDKTGNKIIVKKSKGISYDLDEAVVNTHQELVKIIAEDKKHSRNLQAPEKQISQIEIQGKQYGVAGRFTLDVANNLFTINLIISDPSESPVNLESLTEFEHAYFFSCFKQVTDAALADGRLSVSSLRKFDVKLHTSYIQPEKLPDGSMANKYSYRGVNFPMDDPAILPKHLDLAHYVSGIATESRIGAEMRKKLAMRQIY